MSLFSHFSRPKLILMYTSAVDTAGHAGGPFSQLVNTSLVETDKYIEMIMNGLRDRNLDTCINFILVSDHGMYCNVLMEGWAESIRFLFVGMANMDCSNNVAYLENYGVDMASVYTDLGPFGRIGKSKDKSLWSKFDPNETMKKLECKREETHWEVRTKT